MGHALQTHLIYTNHTGVYVQEPTWLNGSGGKSFAATPDVFEFALHIPT